MYFINNNMICFFWICFSYTPLSSYLLIIHQHIHISCLSSNTSNKLAAGLQNLHVLFIRDSEGEIHGYHRSSCTYRTYHRKSGLFVKNTGFTFVWYTSKKKGMLWQSCSVGFASKFEHRDAISSPWRAKTCWHWVMTLRVSIIQSVVNGKIICVMKKFQAVMT